jgi:hypothetical protein
MTMLTDFISCLLNPFIHVFYCISIRTATISPITDAVADK